VLRGGSVQIWEEMGEEHEQKISQGKKTWQGKIITMFVYETDPLTHIHPHT